jgi:hypothetical protein
VRKYFGVQTEQEAVERALDLALSEQAITRAHLRARGIGGVEDVFGEIG